MSSGEAEIASLRAEVERWQNSSMRFELAFYKANEACSAREEVLGRVTALVERWERDDEESLNTFGQHLMGGAVLVCAEQLSAVTSPTATGGDGRG